jgi:dTDP-4-dehydrorhamnose 3,5-epimerase-like enzyme
MDINIEECAAYHDNRGDIIQFVTKQILEKDSTPFGQVYLLTFTGTNRIRGNHYHNFSKEMFCLISGSVEMVFEDVNSKERLTKIISATDNVFYRISFASQIAHAIRSISDFAVMVSFASKEFDAKEEDKIPYSLI